LLFDNAQSGPIGWNCLNISASSPDPAPKRADLSSPEVSERPDLKAHSLVIRPGLLQDRRQREVRAPADATYRAFADLGGENGWGYMDWAWQLRSAVDRLLGGVGRRPGPARRDRMRIGDVLDFWRIEALEPGRLLRLRAEMKMPGRGWLEFRAEPISESNCLLTQTAFFAPDPFFGPVYWYALYPAHQLLFTGLIRRLAAAAERNRCSH